MEEKTSKLEDRVTAALVIHEEHMSDYHTRLKLILHMAWAKNQSNDTQKKNLPNHWHEVDAPLQRFGMEIDYLKESDGGVVVFNDLRPRGLKHGARDVGQTAVWRCLASFGPVG